ncbi:hypothetical protein QFZ83_000188 [Variovorax sp. W1I1]|uniref:hypothetical protein n=1 Tax=Variovorax sp. W1I1 TaxID=3042309 RepID=UPI002789BB7C|nr:hypothetical protein [Variovorax sp. W1I1]MDQ0606017.1 hypothetical protein [Variovorax sp. W1I1]
MSAAASQVARRLAYAINAACSARGDDDANRIALLAEASQLPVDTQRGLAEHFELVYVELRPRGQTVTGPSAEMCVTGNSNPNLGLFGDVPKGLSEAE